MATLNMFFLACIGALVMASVVESRHPLRHNKRQATEQETSHCLVHFLEVTCTSGSVQALFDLTQRCNLPTASVAGACGRNDNGMLCGAIDTDALRNSAQRSGCDLSSTTCTPECKTQLMNIRDELDCCFSFFNDSSSGSFDSMLFNNALWTSCEVKGAAEMCSNNTLQLNEIQAAPGPTTCDPTAFLDEIFFNISCRHEFIEPLIARMATVEGCEDYITEDDFVSCNTNRFGIHCDDIMFQISANFTAANLNCHNTSTCDPLCLETLNNISRTSGCCFNEDYNNTSTDDVPDWLSYEFYSRCGLESPGHCPLGTTFPEDDETNTGSADTDLTSTAQSITVSSISMTIIALAMYI